MNILHFGIKHMGGTLVFVLHVSAAGPWTGALCRPEHGGEGLSRPALHGCPSVSPDVGADLLAMCQRNIALNSHLLASGGEAWWVPARERSSPVWQVGQTSRTGAPGGRVLPAPVDAPDSGGSGRPGLVSLQVCDGSVLPPLCPRLRCGPPAPSLPRRPRGPRQVSPAPCLTTSLPAEHLPGAKSELLWLQTPCSGPASSCPLS